MSKHDPTPDATKRAIPRVKSVVRGLAHACTIFVAAQFSCAMPSFGLVNLTESEAPLDQDQSSAKEAISVQGRTRVLGNQPGLPMKVAARGGLRLATVNIAGLPYSGHRLANHLLAPLRC